MSCHGVERLSTRTIRQPSSDLDSFQSWLGRLTWMRIIYVANARANVHRCSVQRTATRSKPNPSQKEEPCAWTFPRRYSLLVIVPKILFDRDQREDQVRLRDVLEGLTCFEPGTRLTLITSRSRQAPGPTSSVRWTLVS